MSRFRELLLKIFACAKFLPDFIPILAVCRSKSHANLTFREKYGSNSSHKWKFLATTLEKPANRAPGWGVDRRVRDIWTRGRSANRRMRGTWAKGSRVLTQGARRPMCGQGGAECYETLKTIRLSPQLAKKRQSARRKHRFRLRLKTAFHKTAGRYVVCFATSSQLVVLVAHFGVFLPAVRSKLKMTGFS